MSAACNESRIITLLEAFERRWTLTALTVADAPQKQLRKVKVHLLPGFHNRDSSICRRILADNPNGVIDGAGIMFDFLVNAVTQLLTTGTSNAR